MRLKRLCFRRYANWVDISISDPDLVRKITDVMFFDSFMQIEYTNGWKMIQPYGWHTSREGNILLMCYKDTGEVRSYRLDRISKVLIDDADSWENISNEGYEYDGYSEEPKVSDYDDSAFIIPEIPNIDDIVDATENEQQTVDTPFDEGLEYLDDSGNYYDLSDIPDHIENI